MDSVFGINFLIEARISPLLNKMLYWKIKIHIFSDWLFCSRSISPPWYTRLGNATRKVFCWLSVTSKSYMRPAHISSLMWHLLKNIHDSANNKTNSPSFMTACWHVIGCGCTLSHFPLSHLHLKLSYNRLHHRVFITTSQSPRVSMDGVKSSSGVADIENQSSTGLSKETVEMLIRWSQEAKKQAYCPYSKFRVGAALLTDNNSVITGELRVKQRMDNWRDELLLCG